MCERPNFILVIKRQYRNLNCLIIMQYLSLELGCGFCKQQFNKSNIICHIVSLEHYWRLHFFNWYRVLIVPDMNCLCLWRVQI